MQQDSAIEIGIADAAGLKKRKNSGGFCQPSPLA